MKKLGIVLFMLALALMLGGNALAQTVGDNSVYFVSYYSNANTVGAPDAVVRVGEHKLKSAGRTLRLRSGQAASAATWGCYNPFTCLFPLTLRKPPARRGLGAC